MPSADPPRQESDATATRDERTNGALPEVGDPARLPGLWRDRTFRFIWGGQTASLFGDQVTNLALPWLILLQTHSAFAAGLVWAARYVPFLALALVAGLVADRIERRALAIACDVGRAVALGAVACPRSAWSGPAPLGAHACRRRAGYGVTLLRGRLPRLATRCDQ